MTISNEVSDVRNLVYYGSPVFAWVVNETKSYIYIIRKREHPICL